jgi:CheY-like chemotaxis protein
MSDDLDADDGPLVLLVEDNPDDVVLVRRALRKAGLSVRLQVLDDGEQAASYLDACAHGTAATNVGTPTVGGSDVEGVGPPSADRFGAAAPRPAPGAGAILPAEPPDLVLLDWKLPLRSGEEVLRGLRGEPALQGLPVIVLTTSDEREDVERAYRAGATSYLRKPVDFHALIRLLDTVHLYWLRTNVPPPLGRS